MNRYLRIIGMVLAGRGSLKRRPESSRPRNFGRTGHDLHPGRSSPCHKTRAETSQAPTPVTTAGPSGSGIGDGPQARLRGNVLQGSGKLEGKAAVITGGDSGIGRAVALAFAREGADVLISYLSEEIDAKETARAVEAAGRKCVAVAGDISDEAHCKAIIERAVKAFGKIDVLVNNAAFQMSREDIEEIGTEEFDRTLKTNLYAMFWLTKARPAHPKGGAVISRRMPRRASAVLANSASSEVRALSASMAGTSIRSASRP